MGTKHRDFGTLNGASEGAAGDRTSDLHAPGFIDTTDPETTYGTSDASKPPGVQAGQFWIEESSADTFDTLWYRNSSNDGWIEIDLDVSYDDDEKLQFGTDNDYWFVYNSSGTQFELWTTDNDGGDSDGLVFTVADGGDVLDFTSTPTVGGTNVVLESRTLTGGDGIATIGDLSANRTIAVDLVASGGLAFTTGELGVDEANVDHDALSNFVANEHVDHSSVTLTAGTGLTGGGDITASRTFNVSGLTDSEIAAGAEIAVAKLADGSARQLLQTDAAGTGVEWTDNVDLPGTLDVTGAVTLDDTLTSGNHTITGDRIVFNQLASDDVLMLADRSGVDAGATIFQFLGRWEGTTVASFRFQTGQDTTNKDDGNIRLFTRTSGGTLNEALLIDGSQKSTFSGAIETSGAATLDTGANGSSFGGELTLDGGVLALAETTTPSATAGEGRIYTKTDNKLYFQDGAGTEHELATV